MGVIELYNRLIPTLRQQGYSLAEIGERVGVSRERIRQILKQYYPESLYPSTLKTKEVNQLTGISEAKLRRWAKRMGLRRISLNPRTYYIWTVEDIAEANQELKKLCPICGMGISEKRIKYCSDICTKKGKYKNWKKYRWNRLKGIKEERVCQNCGQVFLVSFGQPQKNCSRPCGVLSAWKKRRNKDELPYTNLEPQ